MDSYVVYYTDGLKEQFWADDEDHAREQANNDLLAGQEIDRIEPMTKVDLILTVYTYPGIDPVSSVYWNTDLGSEGPRIRVEHGVMKISSDE